jgi:XTP/dITP diphosphohydrolase
VRGTILLATRSAGKLRELRPLFAEHGYQTIDLAAAGVVENALEDDLECFDTFEENATAKARYFHRVTSLPTVADDSGLAVEALGGAPGVRSKRWSERPDLSGQELDDENNRLLLAALATNPNRVARYVCAAVFVDGERELVVRGETIGSIIDVPRGSGGFGYDPFFESADLGWRTFGEVTQDEKALVSHRARAVRALLASLTDRG